MRIGGPNAISRWSLLLGFGVLLIVTLLAGSRGPQLGGLADRMLVTGGGVLAGCAVLALAYCTVLRPGGRPPRPVVALVVFALAGAAQGTVVLILRGHVGLVTQDPALLVVLRAGAAVVSLSLIAILVDGVRVHAARMAALHERLTELDEALRLEEVDAARVDRELRDETLAPLRRTIDAIAERLEHGEGEQQVRVEAESLRRLADEEVRPRSHELLLRDAYASAPDVPLVRTTRVRLRDIARLAVTRIAGPTWLAVALPVALSVLFATPGVGLLFVGAATASGIVLLTGGFAIAGRVLGPRLPRRSSGVAALLVLLAYEALAMVGTANLYAWGGLSPLGRWIEWPFLVSLPIMWFVLAVHGAVTEDRRQTEERLAELVAEYELITARHRQRVRHAYQSVGRFLHGGVQAALLADAARVERAADASGAERERLLVEAAADLRELRDRIAAPPPETWTVRDALDDVAGLWTGLLEVRVDYPEDVLARIDAAPATRAAVVDIVAESLTNAVRHGRARHVEIALRLIDERRLLLEVRNDGEPPGETGSGMGTRLLEAVAADWSFGPDADGARLRVEVPIEVPAPGFTAGSA